MREIKLLALDLDGTVLNPEKEIRPGVVNAIAAARKHGVKVVLCTGRARRSMIRFYEQLGLDEPFACYAGARVESREGVLYERTVPAECASEIVEWAHQHEATVFAYIGDDYVYERDNAHTSGYAAFHDYPGICDPELRTRELHSPKMMIQGDPPLLEAFCSWVQERHADTLQAIPIAAQRVEITKKGVNKGSAMRWIAEEYYGFALEDCMAIGDEMLDAEMIRLAGIGVAMQNSEKDLIKLADFVCPSNEHDGVAEAIYRYILRQDDAANAKPTQIKVEEFAHSTGLRVLEQGTGSFCVKNSDTHRPAIQFMGEYRGFREERMQIIGGQEMRYLETRSPEELDRIFFRFFSYQVPALIVCNDEEPPQALIRAAKRHHTPVFTSAKKTSQVLRSVVDYLDAVLAPEESVHANTLVVNTLGVMIRGESGIGKSELALELVRRGHLLVADDVSVVRRIAENRLVAYAPKELRNLMELRGIGIVDLQKMYGLAAVRDVTGVDILIDLVMWQEDTDYERLGFEQKTTELLGVKVPHFVLPVRPGRNMAALVETIVVNYRVASTGFDIEKEVQRRLEALYESGVR